jgi:hypothetical protein
MAARLTYGLPVAPCQYVDVPKRLTAMTPKSDDRLIELSSHDAAFLAQLLERPAAPNPRLAEALRRYKDRALDADNGVFE